MNEAWFNSVGMESLAYVGRFLLKNPGYPPHCF